MQLNHQDSFKSLITNQILFPQMKIEEINFSITNTYYYYSEHEQVSKNSIEESSIRKIFPLTYEYDDINTDIVTEDQLYKITNDIDITPKDSNNSFHEVHKIKKDIFHFKKINKYIGRRKRDGWQFYSKEANHNKFKEDNIVNKIKIYFTNSIMEFINKKYFEFAGVNSKKLLAKIKPNFTKAWKKKDNQEYLSKTIKDIFSSNLSNKCKRYPKNYNKVQIGIVIKNNEAKEVINILNTTMKDMYEIYIGEIKKIPQFHLDNDLVKIEKRNGNEYVKEYKRIAMNLIEIFNKGGRKGKKNYLYN